uniref:phenylalanine-tRNA ligase beta subunit n=1 Tax=Gracilaria usneoides TaxID=172951 RepID=UPI001D116AE3|nr:phenylalanine-tRNA ligase beta subunit [Crassiphycus usneoides]UAD88722.1 phenylalanine-tRNA ligase beta subunit [Crassiphycus usneoides]
MKFSLRWLQQIVDLSGIAFSTLVEKLTVSGFEIENIVYHSSANDTLFDLTTTANRQDVLSVVGLAREISCLFSRPLSYKFYNDSIAPHINCLKLSDYNISLLDLSLVQMNYLYNNASPLWLKYYLSNYGIESSNLLIDISEYIYLKWGQCIQIFDKNKIETLPINYSLFSLQKINSNLLGSQNVKLEVLKYDNLILSTIGFYTNANFQCDILTNSIIIFGQVCDKKYIKRMQKQLNFSTDLSKKCLKSGSRSDFLNAFYEAVQLVRSFGFAILGKFYGYSKPYDISETIILEKSRIHNILGSVRVGSYGYLTVKEIIDLLESLNFVVMYNGLKNIFKIRVPINRKNDVKRPIDIIEEIGRVYGFNKFVSKLPDIRKYRIFQYNLSIDKIYQVRDLLRYLGLSEVQNYSLYYNTIPDNKTEVKVFNPLTQDQSYLRSSLIGQLVINQQHNLRQGNKNIEIFEIGKVFKLNSSSMKLNTICNSYECLFLSGLITNSTFLRQSWSDKPRQLSWFHAKGLIEEFLDKLEVIAIWKSVNNVDESSLFINVIKLLRINRIAIIYNMSDQEIGIFGQLRNCYGDFTYIFEFDFMKLVASAKSYNHINSIIYPYSSYPSVTRDISLTLRNSSSIRSIQQQIYSFNNSLIESVEVFNHYRNNYSNFYNVGLRVIYRAYNRTLNYDDLNRIDKEIEGLLNKYKSC